MTIGSRRAGLACSKALRNAVARGGLEGLFRAIDGMVFAEIDLDLGIDDLVAGDDALVHLFADALFAGGNELIGNRSALDGVDEAEALAALAGANAEVHLAELTAAAGLLLVPMVCFGLAGDRLEIGDLRHVRVHLELVAVLQALLDHVQVQVAHAGDHQLVSLRVAANRKRRVFVGDLGEAGRDLRFVVARLGLHGAGHHRNRKLDRLDAELRNDGVAAHVA